MLSSLLIGSVKFTADETITVGGTPVTVDDGVYYVIDDTALLSLADVICVLVVANTAATTCAATITKGRKIKLAADATFAITWGTGTAVRDALGFTGDLSAASSYEAPDISDLVWSPGQTESPDAPLGVIGTDISDTAVARSGTAIQVATTHNTQLANSFIWRNVAIARNITSSGLGGEAHTFYQNVLRTARTWNLWRNFDDIVGSSVDFTLVSNDRLGPYQLILTEAAAQRFVFTRSAGLAQVDKQTIVEIGATTVPEVTGAA